MTKVLVVETNVKSYGNRDEATGLWLGESAEFVDEMQKNGIGVDYASPSGGFVPLDPRSMSYLDDATMKLYRDDNFVNNALVNTLKPSQVTPSEYASIYYTGGHGVMWDFPDNKELQTIAEAIYQNNGYVMSVCHGIAGLLNLHDAEGNYLIKNKKITGFTATEEILARKRKVVPFLNQKMVEARGGKYEKKRAYASFAVQDGQFITGQNPFSVRAVANKFIEALS
ncbi:type 1 glutamine amidotransferase domain-containing protein [Eupransor demetentiae]|uniref:PfpI/YajL/DJ-1 family (Repair of methylglyoxal-glycated proteins and nucleic acids) (YajL) n=1 Tax=Eupransor demetentiae TaxID=3109584 RepID=A0ABP0ENV0_9LACO|nr:PfpI/YajL/DJ-1 family (repair of methylglyoxal-glycated proteins and nucleic acids) (YajL) [Lactobacillaceae bacterium LMG 33000]